MDSEEGRKYKCVEIGWRREEGGRGEKRGEKRGEEDKVYEGERREERRGRGAYGDGNVRMRFIAHKSDSSHS